MTTDPGIAGPRVLILGDSWIRGLGSERRNSFGRIIARGLGASAVHNLCEISLTAPDIVRDRLPEIAAFGPDIVLVNVGGADSLIFPAARIQAFIDNHAPAHWHGVTGLMPVARYSRTRSRRIRQRIEHVAKIVIKQLVVNVFGGRRRVPLDVFEDAANELLDFLESLGSTIVVLGFGAADGLASPKTNASVAATNGVLERLAANRSHTRYLPTAGLARCWSDYLPDHVHLNAAGHCRIGEGVLRQLGTDVDLQHARSALPASV